MFIAKLGLTIQLINSVVTTQQPISFYEESIHLNNKPQHIYTLEANLDNPFFTFDNELSYNKIYGFEKTSDMTKKNHSLAGVNGMFYDYYGRQLGALIKNGEVVSLTNLTTPIVSFLENDKVYIGEMSIKSYVIGKEHTIRINTINDSPEEKKWALYSNIYGNTTRINRRCINYIIKDNHINEILVSKEPVVIPEDGYVLSYITDTIENDELFTIGEHIQIDYQINKDIGPIREAFQSGGWLVKDGKNISKGFEPFIGNTNIPNPRTLIGVSKDNKLIIKVIDGRQPGYSAGISGFEAAQLMIEEGSRDAVYLDGGASSTLVINDKLINKPSGGEERKVAHSILINFNKKIKFLDGIF